MKRGQGEGGKWDRGREGGMRNRVESTGRERGKGEGRERGMGEGGRGETGAGSRQWSNPTIHYLYVLLATDDIQITKQSKACTSCLDTECSNLIGQPL